MIGDEKLRNNSDDTKNAFRVVSNETAEQLTTSQDLSLGALDYTTSVGSDFLVEGIYISFSGAVTQDITIEYNGIPLREYTITNGSNSYIVGGFNVLGSLGKELTITCTNTVTPAITLTVTIDIKKVI